MSLALEICRIVEGQVGASRLPDVLEVAVEVGDGAGVEPANLEFCLEALLANPPFGRGRPALRASDGDELRVLYLELEEPEEPRRSATSTRGKAT